jgi:hypothetical protein
LNGEDNAGRTKRSRQLEAHAGASVWAWDRIDEGDESGAACSDDDDDDGASATAEAEALGRMARWWGPAPPGAVPSDAVPAAIVRPPDAPLASPLTPGARAVGGSPSGGSAASAAAAPATPVAVPAPTLPLPSPLLRGLGAISLRPGVKHALRTLLRPPPG